MVMSSSAALADLLLALQGLVQRLRLLPSGHPGILPAAQTLERAIAPVLGARDRLVIGVRSVQLVVDGMETSPDYEPLRDLAGTLREAGVGAVEFRLGVTAEELTGVFSALFADPAVLPSGPHLLLRPVSREWTLGQDPWLTLERLLLDDPERRVAHREVAELAIALELHPAGTRGDAAVLSALAAIAQAGATDPDGVSTLSALLTALPAAALRRLFSPVGNTEAQQEFVLAAAPLLPLPLLLRLLQACLPGREARLSSAAVRLTARLVRSEHPTARLAMERVLAHLLARPGAGEPWSPAETAAEPARVLSLALETGIVEEGTLTAADRMIARRQVAQLLALLDTVPRGDAVAQAIRGRLFHPRTVRELLANEPPHLDLLDRLIPAAGIEAAPALLDALASARERRVRLRLLDMLARYGSAVGPLASERLAGMPWYVQRNLLVLLGRIPDRPANFTAGPLLEHRDPRVRQEAIALAIADPDERDAAVAMALAGDHEPTLRLALTALAEYCPPTLLPGVFARATDPALPADVRALAVTALARVDDPQVLRFLRRLVVAGGLTGFGRLAPKSPPMLAALRGLASHWNQHPKAGPVLEAARQSRDQEIRDAARPVARRSGATDTRTVPK